MKRKVNINTSKIKTNRIDRHILFVFLYIFRNLANDIYLFDENEII